MEYDDRSIEIRVRHLSKEPWTVHMSLTVPSALVPPPIQRRVFEEAMQQVLGVAMNRLFGQHEQGGEGR